MDSYYLKQNHHGLCGVKAVNIDFSEMWMLGNLKSKSQSPKRDSSSFTNGHFLVFFHGRQRAREFSGTFCENSGICYKHCATMTQSPPKDVNS